MTNNHVNTVAEKTPFQLAMPEHEEITHNNFTCIVVDGKGSDLIFQFFSVKVQDFENIIAEVIEDHFGSTDNFAIEYVTELSMFGLLYKDAKAHPLFSKEFHIYKFLSLLDDTITAVSA